MWPYGFYCNVWVMGSQSTKYLARVSEQNLSVIHGLMVHLGSALSKNHPLRKSIETIVFGDTASKMTLMCGHYIFDF